MNLAIPIKENWQCPQGKHKAICIDSREKPKDQHGRPKKLIRLVFEIPSLSTPFEKVLAGKNYEPSIDHGSKLRQDIESWLGEGFIEQNPNSEGKFSIEILKGKEADLRIKHHKNEGHEQPYCAIDAILPPSITGKKAKSHKHPETAVNGREQSTCNESPLASRVQETNGCPEPRVKPHCRPYSQPIECPQKATNDAAERPEQNISAAGSHSDEDTDTHMEQWEE